MLPNNVVHCKIVFAFKCLIRCILECVIITTLRFHYILWWTTRIRLFSTTIIYFRCFKVVTNILKAQACSHGLSRSIATYTTVRQMWRFPTRNSRWRFTHRTKALTLSNNPSFSLSFSESPIRRGVFPSEGKKCTHVGKIRRNGKATVLINERVTAAARLLILEIWLKSKFQAFEMWVFEFFFPGIRKTFSIPSSFTSLMIFFI